MDTEMGPEEVERYQYIDGQKKIRGEAVWGVTQAIDVKKRFLRFYSCHVFTFFNVFTARCTLVQSAVLRSHVVCLSVRPSVRL